MYPEPPTFDAQMAVWLLVCALLAALFTVGGDTYPVAVGPVRLAFSPGMVFLAVAIVAPAIHVWRSA